MRADWLRKLTSALAAELDDHRVLTEMLGRI
jgi:hypothetical protein